MREGETKRPVPTLEFVLSTLTLCLKTQKKKRPRTHRRLPEPRATYALRRMWVRSFFQFNQLNEVSTGIVEYSQGHRTGRSGFHRKRDPELLEPLELGMDVLNE